MNENRLLIADYCDDIRHEIGYKYSMMGCYSGELILDALPSVLPKLCASVTALTPIGNPFKKLVFRAFLNDTLLLENEIPPDQLESNQKTLQENAESESTRMSLKIQLTFTPLIVETDSTLRVEAETEDGVLNGSRIKLRKRTDSDPPLIQQFTQ